MLEKFLAEAAARSFVWGESDCSLMPADWCVANGYADPAAHLRGKYGCEQSCEELLSRSGGLLAVFRDCAQRIGLEEVEHPTVGSVSVIGSPTVINKQWGAIFDGQRWRVRFVNGVHPVTARPLTVWEV